MTDSGAAASSGGTGSGGGDAERLEQLREEAIAFAEGLADACDLDVGLVAEDEDDGIILSFDGPDAKYLVGRGGQVLDALQYLATLAIHKRGGGPRLRILFDADDYRVRRENTLKKLAADLADQVRSTGQEAVLDPLSPLERRIVHRALTEEAGVRTYSEGEEPERYIVIAPAA
jgi:spoIIIJ-associated protein